MRDPEAVSDADAQPDLGACLGQLVVCVLVRLRGELTQQDVAAVDQDDPACFRRVGKRDFDRRQTAFRLRPIRNELLGQLLALLRGLNGINIVGADVVEVAPAYDHADITTVAAATLVFDLLALMVNRSKAEPTTVRELQAASWTAS